MDTVTLAIKQNVHRDNNNYAELTQILIIKHNAQRDTNNNNSNQTERH